MKSAYSESAQHKVAIKIVNKRKAPKDFLRKFLPRELHVLININHENIIKTHEILNLGYKVTAFSITCVNVNKVECRSMDSVSYLYRYVL